MSLGQDGADQRQAINTSHIVNVQEKKYSEQQLGK